MENSRENSDRWVNGHVELLIPLNVPPDADPFEKQQALSELLERVSSVADLIGRNLVMRAWWEDMRDEDRCQAGGIATAQKKKE